MARTELRSHPKFKRLMRALNLPAPYVMGLLECMWQVGYQSGNDLLGNADDVELAAEWPGHAGRFFAAVRVDFLDFRDGFFHIHDLFDHAPEYVKKKLNRRALKNKELPQETADNGCQTADIDRLHTQPVTPNQEDSDAAHRPQPAEPAKRQRRRAATERTSGDDHNALIAHFTAAWQKRFGSKYAFQGAKDGSAVGRILAASENDLTAAKRIVTDFIADDDPFITKTGHSLAVLPGQVNRYKAGAHHSPDAFKRRTPTPEELQIAMGVNP